jgi:hypothetical protein
MRTVSIAGVALAALALGGALSACGSQGGNAAGGHVAATSSPAPSSSGRSSSPPPVTVPPDITVVRLSSSFSPSRLRLSVGQQFLLIVSASVRVRGLDAAAGCGSSAAGTAAGGTVAGGTVAGGTIAGGTVVGTVAGGTAVGGSSTGGLLSVRCTSGGYLYTAEHSGTGTISATVGPRCSPGQMCPQWLAEAQLHVVIT